MVIERVAKASEMKNAFFSCQGSERYCLLIALIVRREGEIICKTVVSGQGSGESCGRIPGRAYAECVWWYPGSPNARDPGHPQLNKIQYETRATRRSVSKSRIGHVKLIIHHCRHL